MKRLWIEPRPKGKEQYHTTRICGPVSVVSAGPSLEYLTSLPDQPTVWVNKAIFHPLAEVTGPRPIWHTYEEAGRPSRRKQFRDRVESLGALVWGKIPRHWDAWDLHRAQVDFVWGIGRMQVDLGVGHIHFRGCSSHTAILVALRAGAERIDLWCSDLSGSSGYISGNPKRNTARRWAGERRQLNQLKEKLPIVEMPLPGPRSTSSPLAPVS